MPGTLYEDSPKTLNAKNGAHPPFRRYRMLLGITFPAINGGLSELIEMLRILPEAVHRTM